MLSRIANFDDVDPLATEPEVDLVMVPPGQPVPPADIVIIPGTKSTIADLAFFRAQGWDIDLDAHVRRGGRVIGLCGGYQMLGKTITDPEGIEGLVGTVDGLGLLDVDTVLEPHKVTQRVSGEHVRSSSKISGYEIHVGRTTGTDTDRPALMLDGVAVDRTDVAVPRVDGAISQNGRVWGTYVHGIFGSNEFRQHVLADFGVTSTHDHEAAVDKALDHWADQIEREVDLDGLLEVANNRI